jgi:predicted membrane protein
MRHPTPTSMIPAAMAATTLLMVILSPASLVPRVAARLREARDDESGEIVQSILWVAGFAAIAIAVIAIIRTFVLNEANNLPTSGNVGQ